MSAHSRRLIVAPKARQDLEDIIAWTRGQWGVQQADEYGGAIDAAFVRLLDFPESGRKRDQLRLGLRSMQVKRHLIYYTFADPEITVLRILHERMDAAAHISP